MSFAYQSFYHEDETYCVDSLLQVIEWNDSRSVRVQDEATAMIARARSEKRPAGELESLLRHYGLDTQEGRALMALAEAYLRIPDSATRTALLSDKIGSADWKTGKNVDDWLVNATGMGLGLSRKLLGNMVGRLGAPVIREATGQAIRMIGKQFVLGRTIEEALHNARPQQAKGYWMSYDMLGEGARTMEDAERYFTLYEDAIHKIGKNASGEGGISVKLSALHPRYVFTHAEKCVPFLQEKLMHLATLAAQYNIGLTVDAEEADRLDLSLDIFTPVFKNPTLQHWSRFGVAIQSYQKRCFPLIDHLYDMARGTGKRIEIRLVKGAYWDTEIKRAQVGGYNNYPVFTRKENTDLSWLACAQKMMNYGDFIYPKFGTHNAHSLAAILEMRKNKATPFEFQAAARHGSGAARPFVTG